MRKSKSTRKKLQKGDYGYRNYHKKNQLLMVVFGAIMILVQLIARTFVGKEWQNILTVMAILSVLPTANLASPLLASWIYKTGDIEVYKKIRNKAKGQRVLYDLIITSKKSIMPVEAAVIHPTGVYLYAPSNKIVAKEMETFLNSNLEGNRLTPNTKVIKEEISFLNCIGRLKDSSEYEEEDGSLPHVEQLLKNISM